VVSGDGEALRRSPLVDTPAEVREPGPGLTEGPTQDEIERRETLAWSPARRLLFRLGLLYLFLYNFPFPFNIVPGLEPLMAKYQALWDALVPWVGRQLFGLDISVKPNGSGDTTYNYVQVLCFAVLALVGAVAWTLADRKRVHYARLAEWLRIYVRYVLALTLLSYGLAKVIPSQFPAPGLDRMLQSFGDASPMGLLWTFMGASAAYTVFSGLAEVVPGLLLTVRRTTLLGALLAIAVLTNVVMLNFCYDVPVKLYSSHLLGMAVFVAWPDARRLADMFVRNRPVPPMPIGPLFRRKWLERSALALRTVLVLAYVAYGLYGTYEGNKTYGFLAPKSPLYGIWNVDELVVDGQPRPPLITDEERWRRVVFDYPGFISFQLMGSSRRAYRLELDEKAHTLKLTKRDDPAAKSVLTYRREGDRLALAGTLEGKQIRARLTRTDESQFLLRSRGFHWINEYPYNR
jgi:hypothetical protein